MTVALVAGGLAVSTPARATVIDTCVGGQSDFRQLEHYTPVGQTFTATDSGGAVLGVYLVDINSPWAPLDLDVSVTLHQGTYPASTPIAQRVLTAHGGLFGWAYVDLLDVPLVAGQTYTLLVSNDNARWGIGVAAGDYPGGNSIVFGGNDWMDNCIQVLPDVDGDWVAEGRDNCLFVPNPVQQDLDADGVGDACDPDVDGDGRPNVLDNCERHRNPDQFDLDRDGLGDPCDSDRDEDLVGNAVDNCPDAFNPAQIDTDADAQGDACDPDDDNDTVSDGEDVRPTSPDRCRDADGDTCDDCAVRHVPASLEDGLDTDADGACDAGDLDDDNDTVWDAVDAMPRSAFSCRDGDLDGCDDCALAGFPAPVGDGPDADADGACDRGDLDDDNDTVPDLVDLAPLARFSCGDVEHDGCDDCAWAGFPVPANDGPDNDSDGACDPGDADDDNDLVPDTLDAAPFVVTSCGDFDADGCDDCGIAGRPSPTDDGPDTDADGACNVGDADDDGDTVPDEQDPEPLDAWRCRDLDHDLCDDCAVAGHPDPTHDGPDLDGDGACNAGDTDDDEDEVADVDDVAPLDTWMCRDSDADGCDDCGVQGYGSPRNDGPDHDGDGACDAGDADDDGDTVHDLADVAPLDASACRDLDHDGCDDCTVAGSPEPPNDGPDLDGDGLCDSGDIDADGDGVYDFEDACTGLADDQRDTDLDWLGDACDPDDDNDGRLDDEEVAAALDPRDPDVDDDGIGDGDEALEDTDADGRIDALDDDSDGDGILDAEEAGDGDLATPPADTDGDGLPDVRDLDSDDDGAEDGADVCRTIADPGQEDLDGDGAGDACDDDRDGDGIPDRREEDWGMDPDGLDSDADTIPDAVELPHPLDTDRDGTVDALDDDSDGDGIADAEEAGDADPATPPVDTDGDGAPDYVDIDSDGDGVIDTVDVCRLVPDRTQPDLDEDGIGDRCDGDRDGDGAGDELDVCPAIADPSQADLDGDGLGDACDLDADGDEVADDDDLCLGVADPDQADVDLDRIGDACDDDDDGDGTPDADDVCPRVADAGQDDQDRDGLGDACDADLDGDGVPNETDVCPVDADAGQADLDGDGDGDACDVDRDGDGTLDEADRCPEVAATGAHGCPPTGGSSGGCSAPGAGGTHPVALVLVLGALVAIRRRGRR